MLWSPLSLKTEVNKKLSVLIKNIKSTKRRQSYRVLRTTKVLIPSV